MKKTYATPTVVVAGDTVLETKSGGGNPEFGTSQGPGQAPGSVGFYL